MAVLRHDGPMSRSLIATQQTTIEHFLDRSSRDVLPLQRTFLQQKDANGRPRPGPLATFVKRSREGALDQFLFAHAIASQADDQTEAFDVRLHAAVWARAAGGYVDPKSGEVAESDLHAVSRNWRFLAELKLVRTERVKRLARVTLRADDGSDEPYRHIAEGRRGQKLAEGDSSGYLRLPYAYWRNGWYLKLDLVGKVMLLIALSAGDGFPLPTNKGPDWYGVSPATIERGLRQLRDLGLLHREKHRRVENESPVGFADLWYYELRPPFGPRGYRSSSAHANYRGPSGSQHEHA